MSRIITTTVYTLHELSSTAQEKARDWYRQHHADSNWYENVYEDFRAVCGIFGIDSYLYSAKWYISWVRTTEM